MTERINSFKLKNVTIMINTVHNGRALDLRSFCSQIFDTDYYKLWTLETTMNNAVNVILESLAQQNKLDDNGTLTFVIDYKITDENMDDYNE